LYRNKKNRYFVLNMKENSHRREREEMQELLLQYQKLKSGANFNFLEEEAFERIIDYYDENEQLNLALEAAECGIRQFPFSSLLLVKKADLLIASHHFDSALEILDQASVLDSSDINIYILRIDAWLGLNNLEKAKQLYQSSLNLFEGQKKIEYLFELTDVFDDYELFAEVFDCLSEILKEAPLNHEALFKISFWADYASKWEESIELHNDLIDEHPYNHLAWFNLGAAYQGLKLYEKAIDAYLYAVSINEKFEFAYRNLGDAYMHTHNYEEAIEALEKVLELSLPEDIIYEALGHCYEKLRNSVQARSYFRKAQHLNPENSQLYYFIAITYMNERKWNNALDQLQHAIHIAPSKYPNYYFAISQCYQYTGKTQDAVNCLLQYINQKPTLIKGWKELITLLYDNGYYNDALRECENAFKLTNGKMLFVFFKAANLIKSGKKSEGLEILESAIKKSPKLLKEFISLDPSFLQRPSVVRVINHYLAKKEKRRKKKQQ